MSKDYTFRLYILDNDKSKKLLVDLKSMLTSELKDNYEIEVVNPLGDNNRTGAQTVFILPTLIKISPSPSRTVIGNLSDRDKIFHALGIKG